MVKRRCAWAGCRVMVAPYLWGCRKHWFRLPLQIRRDIQSSYTPKQEEQGISAASAEYRAAVLEADRWIRDYGGST